MASISDCLDYGLVATPAKKAKRERAPARQSGEVWLDENVILCACPDCRAPMSVRLWLMMADCWRCSTTIELSQEQERQVEELLARRQPPQVPSPPPAPPPIQPA